MKAVMKAKLLVDEDYYIETEKARYDRCSVRVFTSEVVTVSYLKLNKKTKGFSPVLENFHPDEIVKYQLYI